MTDVADFLSGFIEKFRGERAAAYAGAVGFEYTIYFADATRGNAQACAGACTDGVGRGNKRVGTEIDIEQGSLGTFGQYRLVVFQQFVDFVFTVNEAELFQVVERGKPLCFELGNVVGVVE